MSSNTGKSSKLLLVTFVILVTIPMSISQSEEEDDFVAESWGSTDVKISKLTYLWNITNFEFCCQRVGTKMISPTFAGNDGCNWYMEIRPKGDDEDNEEYVSLYLFSVTCNSSTTVEFSILNGKDEQTNSRTFYHKYQQPGKNWGFKSYILYSTITNKTNDLLHEGNLYITCQIVTIKGTENTFVESTQPKRHLVEDFGLLLKNQILTDVTLVAGEMELKAHKAILGARSSVFKAMFDQDAGKRNYTAVEINDVDPQALSAMLRYIYTEEVSNLEEMAPKLLGAAENYKLAGLKTLCENVLRSKLSVQNAVDFFLLGDKYSADGLKNEAKKFIVVHASDIANTTEFKLLVLKQPRLVVEVLDLVG